MEVTIAMTHQDELRENYEDALFALLMNSWAEEEGKRLNEENERLKADPAFEVPESFDRRSLRAIRRYSLMRKLRSYAKTAAYLLGASLFLSSLVFTTYTLSKRIRPTP